jgi:AcrR family transcriptional regulator
MKLAMRASQEMMEERTHLLSPQERRLRNRQEVSEAILTAAREIMRRDGVAALNLNEVARLVGMQTPSLYKYFASKFALYDELFRVGVRLFRESEERVWSSSQPIWERIGVWFETRLLLAQEQTDLYHLVFDNPVPGFVPSQESLQESRKIRLPGVRAIQAAIDASSIASLLPAERIFDLLLAMRRGIIAEHLGKETHLPTGDERFRSLIPEVLALLQSAWAPKPHQQTPS